MRVIAALSVSSMLLLAQSDQPAPHTVTAVRYWSLTGVTRVAVEVSSAFEFHTDRLHNPERVYYDISNTRPRIDSKRIYNEVVADKLLQRIRVAETTPGTTRIVLDLTTKVDATTSTLTNPHRLIIELRAAAGTPVPTTPTTAANSPAPADHEASPKAPVLPPVSVKPISPAVKENARVDLPGVTPAAPLLPPAPELPKNETAKIESPKLESPKPESPASPPAGGPRSSALAAGEEVAKAAKHTSAGTNSLIRTLGLKINRVVIDPGHGGHDQGCEGGKGLLEKDLVLDVALRVGQLVQDRMGAEVIYTRSDDTFIPLEGRTALANEKKADLFLSIHANSSPIPRISGVETYYLNINGSKDAMDVASRENGATQRSIFDLQDIIQKITLHDKSEESHEFAKRVQASLYNFNLKNFPASKDRGVKTAPFIVLIGANMPSILAEIGFVTNSKEESLLKKPEYRQKLAEALYKGMEKYTESLSHFQVAARP